MYISFTKATHYTANRDADCEKGRKIGQGEDL